MRRLIGRVALSTVLSMAPVVTSATVASAAQTQRCTQLDVEALAHRPFDVARLHFNHPAKPGWLNDWADRIWNDCQFRLFDDNDAESGPDNPEVPHVFSTRDYILGGVVIFELRDGPQFDRAAAIASMTTTKDRVFWGPASVADGALAEVGVTVGPYQDGLSPLGDAVGNQRYFIFHPGRWAPGRYKWRFEEKDPVYGDFVARGAVVITR